MTRALNPVENHPERITQELRKQSEELNWKGIEFPMEVDKIDKFEKNNPTISVNVFYIDGDIQPLRNIGVKRDHIINLLLIGKEGKKHYCWIKNMRRLLSNQVTKHDGDLSFCLLCLNKFPNKEKLKSHEEYCSKKEAVKTIMPVMKVKDSDLVFPKIISFKSLNRFMKHPFVVYADFEAFLENIDSCEPDNRKSFTEKYQKHKPC